MLVTQVIMVIGTKVSSDECQAKTAIPMGFLQLIKVEVFRLFDNLEHGVN